MALSQDWAVNKSIAVAVNRGVGLTLTPQLEKWMPDLLAFLWHVEQSVAPEHPLLQLEGVFIGGQTYRAEDNFYRISMFVKPDNEPGSFSLIEAAEEGDQSGVTVILELSYEAATQTWLLEKAWIEE